MNYWLIKSEEDSYSIDDIKKDKIIDWFGIRNYQARNFMRDDMKLGDLVLFYHSNAKPSGVHGLVRVASTPHVDMTALDKNNQYFDRRSTVNKPIWECVDFEFVKKFPKPVSLNEIKLDDDLSGMRVALKGQRLSIQPVELKHFKRVLDLGEVEF